LDECRREVERLREEGVGMSEPRVYKSFDVQGSDHVEYVRREDYEKLKRKYVAALDDLADEARTQARLRAGLEEIAGFVAELLAKVLSPEKYRPCLPLDGCGNDYACASLWGLLRWIEEEATEKGRSARAALAGEAEEEMDACDLGLNVLCGVDHSPKPEPALCVCGHGRELCVCGHGREEHWIDDWLTGRGEPVCQIYGCHACRRYEAAKESCPCGAIPPHRDARGCRDADSRPAKGKA
jgi:hypothetical protein